MGKKIILKTEIPREKGMLYYTGTDKDGNLTLCSVEMSRGKKKTAKKSSKKSSKK